MNGNKSAFSYFRGSVELARKTEVPVFTVRHYTRIGLLKPLWNRRNNYKMYQFSDTTRLRFIIAAKDLGFTLTEISEILDEAKHGKSPCPMVREIVKKRLEENKKKIRELKNLQKKNGIGVLFPVFGLLLSPLIASAAMTFSSVSVILNALRLRNLKL